MKKIIFILLLLPVLGYSQKYTQFYNNKDLYCDLETGMIMTDTLRFERTWIYDTIPVRLVYYKNDFTLGWRMAYEVLKRRPKTIKYYFVGYLDIHRVRLEDEHEYFKL